MPRQVITVRPKRLTGTVYGILFPNNMWYVGQTVDYLKRIKTHKKNAETNKPGILYDAIREWGWDSLQIEPLKEITIEIDQHLDMTGGEMSNELFKALSLCEVKIGLELNALHPSGYSSKLGEGEDQIWSDTLKEKARKKALGRTFTETHKKKISDSRKGLKSYRRLIIGGSVPSLKNSKNIYINKKTGKPFVGKSQNVTDYMDETISKLSKLSGLSNYRVKVDYKFYYKDRIRRDLDNAIATINDCLVKSGYLSDDNWKVLEIGSAVAEIDKDKPRTEVSITPLEKI